MIEVLKEFLLFGVIEVFILLMFYKYVGKIDKVKYWHGLVLCPLFFVVGLIQFPYTKQLGMIIIMVVYLYVIIKKLNFRIVMFSSLYLLVIEMIFCVLLDITIGFNFTMLNIINKFLVMIPIRFVEVSLIFVYKRRN